MPDQTPDPMTTDGRKLDDRLREIRQRAIDSGELVLRPAAEILGEATVPAAEVQALVERWQTRAAETGSGMFNADVMQCADELAKLIPRNPE